jgi:hypothetical protein
LTESLYRTHPLLSFAAPEGCANDGADEAGGRQVFVFWVNHQICAKLRFYERLKLRVLQVVGDTRAPYRNFAVCHTQPNGDALNNAHDVKPAWCIDVGGLAATDLLQVACGHLFGVGEMTVRHRKDCEHTD